MIVFMTPILDIHIVSKNVFVDKHSIDSLIQTKKALEQSESGNLLKVSYIYI